MEKAQDQAATAGLGGNERNKLAQAMVKMKFGPNNWTPDEQAAIQGAITPNPGEQILRTLGKADPTAHGGVGMVEAPIAGLVGLEGGMPGMAAAAGTIASAAAARRISDAMMRQRQPRAQHHPGGRRQSLSGAQCGPEANRASLALCWPSTDGRGRNGGRSLAQSATAPAVRRRR
jgi:hypothetical protein